MSKPTITLISFLILIFYSQNLVAQEPCNCQEDLKILHKKIKKTPSYKQNKKAYLDLYSKTINKAENANSRYECYVLFNKLLLGINDNHCNVYGIEKGASAEIRKDSNQVADFKKSPIYFQFPRLNIDLDSLMKISAAKANSDVEGIYYLKDYLKIAVYKSDEDFIAVILESQKGIWEAGEVLYTMVPYGNNYLRNIGGDLGSKKLIAYPERIQNGLFLTMGFRKELSDVNNSRAPYPDSNYVRKEISNETTYLKIGSFNSWYPTLSDAEKFYKTLEGSLNKKNLIIDLRDNGGGGNRNSDILLDLIEEYMKENKVFVITNNRTGSNAEQFTFKISQNKNCRTFGHRTSGTLAYELKNSNHVLPCGNFLAVLTSKKHKKFLAIESRGIEPQVKLKMDSDWINQMLEIMSKND